MQPPENTMRHTHLLITILVLLVAGCGSTSDIDQSPVPVGPMVRADLTGAFLHAYPQQPIAPPLVDLIRRGRGEAKVLIFLGTWCSDSKREVSRFFQIADSTGMTPDDYMLYGLDRKKASPEGMERQYQIDRVPTFILLLRKKEIGRIVETPKTTLEGDILNILAHPGS
jgi:hypothetical protein